MKTLQPSRRFSAILSRGALAVGIVAVFVVLDTFYAIEEGQVAVVTRFGRPVREIVEAGPYWKWPTPIDTLHVFDRRRRIFVTPEVAHFTRDKKNIVLSTYVVWHVERPLAFLQAVGNAETAETNLAGLVGAAKTQRIGRHDLSALVSTRRENLHVEEIETEITAETSTAALTKMGVVVDQVGIERIAFPAENLAAVFDRMRTERQAEANRLRAEGAKAAQAIRDEAHVKSQDILRVGRNEASQIAAEAERRAADLLSAIHKQNPGFYKFWSSLQASKRVLKEKSTLILTSDQLFFDGLMSLPADTPIQRTEPAESALNGNDDSPLREKK